MTASLVIANIWLIACRCYGSPLKAFKVTRRLMRNFSKMMEGKRLRKGFYTSSGYRWDLYNPAWPSRAFNRFFENHLHEIEPISPQHTSLRRIIIAITKRCPLSCEHCSEGDSLHQPDVLSYEQLCHLLDAHVGRGLGQILYSGGEPLSRFQDLLKLIRRYRRHCEQWVYTSGYGLSAEKARQLYEAGLRCAAVSLDHHQPLLHNKFRNHAHAYQWAMQAIANLQQAGIFVAVNTCVTREYLARDGVETMLQVLVQKKIGILNLIEPRAVGYYSNKDVELQPEHKKKLAQLAAWYNFRPENKHLPTIIYPAGYRNTLPCGGGRSYAFIDYDGSMYPCPFCRKKTISDSTANACAVQLKAAGGEKRLQVTED